MYRILIVSEDFVLRKAVAFSLNDLDACVECADTVSAMLVLHRESPFDLVSVMGTAAEMCRQEVMDTLRADKTRRTRSSGFRGRNPNRWYGVCTGWA